jgi:ribonuclease-3
MNKTEMVDKNYKSIYLEFIQSKGFSSPTYRVLEESGPDHEKIFVVGVYVNNELMGVGEGKSKKQAEQIAAERAVKNSALNDDKNMEE